MKTELIQELKEGKIIGHTTDTVIGLMGLIERENIFKINQLKSRAIDQPLQILIANVKQAENIVKDINVLVENQEPKTSYLVEVNDEFGSNVLLPSFNKAVMIRIVDGELAEIINEVGPLFASSANLHGQDFLTDYQKVELLFNVKTNKKNQEGGKPSRIVSLVNGTKEIIRE